MKNLRITLMISLMALMIANVSVAQSNSRIKKEAKREAKELGREGFTELPGAPLLKYQLEKAWKKQLEEDEYGYPMFIVASGNGIAESETVAKLQANETAKYELAGTISTSVAGLIKGNYGNAQLNNEDAATITEIIGNVQNLVAQEIGRVVPLVEIHRKVGKNVEVNVRIAYNSEMAKEVAKKVIRKELQEKIQLQNEKISKLLDTKK